MLWSILISLALADQPTRLPLNHVRGKQLYDDLCFQCHGELALAENQMAKATGTPPLAGTIPKEEYKEAIKIIQEGKGMMPGYEMTIDKHDAKRILIYLSRLDPETGLDPNPKDYEDQEEKDKEEKEKDDIGLKNPKKKIPKLDMVAPSKLKGKKKEDKKEEKEEEEK